MLRKGKNCHTYSALKYLPLTEDKTFIDQANPEHIDCIRGTVLGAEMLRTFKDGILQQESGLGQRGARSLKKNSLLARNSCTHPRNRCRSVGQWIM